MQTGLSHTQIHLLEHLDPVFDITAVDRILEPGGEVTPVFRDLGHSGKLLLVTSGQVQERELIKVPLFLIGHLDRLVVTMSKSLNSESIPEVGTVQFTRHLDRDLQIATLDSQIETGLRILYELQRNLWVTLLLKIGDDTLTDQARGFDNLQHFVVVPLDQRKLEPIFGRVNLKDARLSIAIKAVDIPALHTHEVNGLVESADNAVVTATAR